MNNPVSPEVKILMQIQIGWRGNVNWRKDPCHGLIEMLLLLAAALLMFLSREYTNFVHPFVPVEFEFLASHFVPEGHPNPALGLKG